MAARIQGTFDFTGASTPKVDKAVGAKKGLGITSTSTPKAAKTVNAKKGPGNSFSKYVSSTLFTYGISVTPNAHNVFLGHLSQTLRLGNSRSVSLFLGENEYCVDLKYFISDGDKTLHFIWDDCHNTFRAALKKAVPETYYDYCMKHPDGVAHAWRVSVALADVNDTFIMEIYETSQTEQLGLGDE